MRSQGRRYRRCSRSPPPCSGSFDGSHADIDCFPRETTYGDARRGRRDHRKDDSPFPPAVDAQLSWPLKLRAVHASSTVFSI
ncbi:hypothetical protein GW17_00057963 [Ensete ventricosum]|uniref:Uncharacterized protein n=1 Tax=Ensete ventricosum TaxID=4639 RepID=A0A444C4G8_ENSVE|nr:hypothetical protein B296_00044814 [Ensete ventricosum]RWV80715.1 hypothetical protein GW17_00057963 [Ensete ventricosum]RZS11142.1 hypothetical protein BHM03_00042457 [Ensete ventricosum]